MIDDTWYMIHDIHHIHDTNHIISYDMMWCHTSTYVATYKNKISRLSCCIAYHRELAIFWRVRAGCWTVGRSSSHHIFLDMVIDFDVGAKGAPMYSYRRLHDVHSTLDIANITFCSHHSQPHPGASWPPLFKASGIPRGVLLHMHNGVFRMSIECFSNAWVFRTRKVFLTESPLNGFMRSLRISCHEYKNEIVDFWK